MLDELDDIQIIDSGGDELDINANGSINVEASQLDIDDLVHTTDSVNLGDGTSLWDLQTLDSAFNDVGVSVGIAGVRQDAAGSPVSADGDAHPFVFNNDGELKVAADLSSTVADNDADSGNPIKMGGRGVSGVLTALSASNDRYDLLGDLYRRTWVNTSANIAIKSTAVTVGVTEVNVAPTGLAGRRFITIQNEGSSDIFIGATGVTTSTGTKISKKSSGTYEIAEDVDVFAISGSAGQDVRVFEAA